ncbi:hypothetical protein RHMOL_RhmolUnG0004900 [Rhododendron molle]|nr:hypothetical protein RHMOL_RhmolUnG0004900 [Rhododendron molle]
MPSSFAAKPRRTEYDGELVLRDPDTHISNTWTEMYIRVLIEQLLAYEVLRMYPPTCKHPNLSTLPRALIWSKENMGTKEGRCDLNAFRLYLDDLRASQEPNEWVNEAVRRMLAIENVIRRATSGMPLELHYPAPTPPPAQRAAAQRREAQGRAASRSKRTWSPLQKKIAARTPTPPVTSQRQTRSSLPVDASQEAAWRAVVHVEQQYQIKMRERPSQDEPARKKQVQERS